MIVVADGRAAQLQSGRFRIANLPAGKYTLHEVGDDGSEHTTDIALDVDKDVQLL